MKTQTLRKKLVDLRDSLTDRLGITKKKPGARKDKARKVGFGAVKVVEFERLLCGGGGVPDADSVSLGLGKPVRTYTTEVRERPPESDKDTYCVHGCLDVRKRAALLSDWMSKRGYLQMLRKVVKPELISLKKGREQTNMQRANQREMPMSLEEAQLLAQRDARLAWREGAGRPVLASRPAEATAPAAAAAGGRAAAGPAGAEEELEEDDEGAPQPARGAGSAAPAEAGPARSVTRARGGRVVSSPMRLRAAPPHAAGAEEEEGASDDEEEGGGAQPGGAPAPLGAHAALAPPHPPHAAGQAARPGGAAPRAQPLAAAPPALPGSREHRANGAAGGTERWIVWEEW